MVITKRLQAKGRRAWRTTRDAVLMKGGRYTGTLLDYVSGPMSQISAIRVAKRKGKWVQTNYEAPYRISRGEYEHQIGTHHEHLARGLARQIVEGAEGKGDKQLEAFIKRRKFLYVMTPTNPTRKNPGHLASSSRLGIRTRVEAARVIRLAEELRSKNKR